MVGGCRSKLDTVVSGVPQGSVLGPYCSSYTPRLELFSILENKLIGHADDSALIAVVPSSGVRVTVAESLSRDLVKISDWCDLWMMKLNVSKTKTMIVVVVVVGQTVGFISSRTLAYDCLCTLEL